MRSRSAPRSEIPRAGSSTLSGLLQSPHFLYREELGEPDEGDRIRYSDHELATRLAYFLWNAPPDESLLDAAERGELADLEGGAAHVDAMLADPRSEGGLRAFVADLFAIGGLATAEKEPLLHPDFDRVRPALEREFVESASAALAEGGFRALFTSRVVYLDRDVAPLYGLDATQFGDDLRRVELPSDSARAGALTSPAFLAMLSYPGKTSPALRGLFVRRSLLCQDVPPPPPGVDTRLPEQPDERLVTTRELVAIHQRERSCARCHGFMDPIGLALESFDAVGRYRETENGLPIDPSGVLDGVSFDDARGLAEALAAHPLLLPCMAARIFGVAAGATAPATDPRILAMADEAGDARAMMRAVALSALFRTAWRHGDEVEAP